MERKRLEKHELMILFTSFISLAFLLLMFKIGFFLIFWIFSIFVLAISIVLSAYYYEKLGMKSLCICYLFFCLCIILFFGFMYQLVWISEVGGLMDKNGILDLNIHSSDPHYFSGVTFFSLGYGDIYPIGLSKLLAIIEVFIGHFFTVVIIATLLQKAFLNKMSKD